MWRTLRGLKNRKPSLGFLALCNKRMKFYEDSTSVHSCFFLFTSPVFLFSTKQRVLLVLGLWSRQGTFLRGAQAPFLDTSQRYTFFLPSLRCSLSRNTSAPLSPCPPSFLTLSLAPSLSDSSSSLKDYFPALSKMILLIRHIWESVICPLATCHQLISPAFTRGPAALSPSRSHSPSLCWASVCLVKTVESLTSVDACDFSQAPEGPRERALCVLTTRACKEELGLFFCSSAFLAGCLTSIAEQCRFQVKDLGSRKTPDRKNSRRETINRTDSKTRAC